MTETAVIVDGLTAAGVALAVMGALLDLIVRREWTFGLKNPNHDFAGRFASLLTWLGMTLAVFGSALSLGADGAKWLIMVGVIVVVGGLCALGVLALGSSKTAASTAGQTDASDVP
ncbi:hypothetical protein EXE59_09800 [Nocardioides eburneiflavus]|uniref:Uncharacterized protein n=1 Tax=Nocardioides eburneiflavus TaxID=2518372 RepID=A0A4Z1C4Y6_9ACTN|nr:hypothetical protein [Nocardioides eburneiflavus]TGN64212.1 hypothetical protein EXE59_09800 [Nocardioides eburneiflavus]